MNLEREINEFLQDPERKKQLMATAMEALEERIKEQFRWQLPDTIAKECNDFITEHVAPEVRAHLVAEKGVIVAAAKAAADEISTKLADSLVEKAEGNLDRSWSADKIIKSLFD